MIIFGHTGIKNGRKIRLVFYYLYNERDQKLVSLVVQHICKVLGCKVKKRKLDKGTEKNREGKSTIKMYHNQEKLKCQ